MVDDDGTRTTEYPHQRPDSLTTAPPAFAGPRPRFGPVRRVRRIRNVRRRWRNGERGAVVVEAALVTPLLFFMIFLIIETGPLFLLWSSNKHATQEGARMATVAGSTSNADYNVLKAMRSPLGPVGNRLNFIILFRANGPYDTVPMECVNEAEAAVAANLNSDTAVGYFKRTDVNPAQIMKTGDGQTALTGFDWTTKRPAIACNVYRLNQISKPVTSFQYDSTAPVLSLDRFWPANRRNDTLAARQDYVGVYVRSQYTSMTGIIKSRRIAHTYVGLIEALKVKA